MKRKVLYQGKFLRLLGEKGWEYVERINCSGVVIILAMTDEKKIIFAEQYRVPVGKKVIEFPAGLVSDLASNKEESFEQAALRELLEETGYRAKKVIPLVSGPVNTGLSTDVVYFFQALGLERQHDGGGDETECITVHEVPLHEVEKWLLRMRKAGKLIDPKVYAGLYFLHNGKRKATKP